MAYDPKLFESKWQTYWEDQSLFKAETGSKKPKYYILDMFPYPSSSGLHVGHPEGYTATDILSRYKRAQGFNVLHPMGWDAFGLPAEQYALQTGVHPAVTTQKAIDNFRGQLKRLGFSYDWSRELTTCDPNYYKWTQYIFLKLFERGLAYQKEVPVNWCPELKTVLANEEVIDGRSERGGHPVFRVPMKQWMLKITDYAERLLKGLDQLDWPEGTKQLQRNWIGKSEGLQLRFPISASGETKESQNVEIFTTRPDTLFGVTYLVLAPEHPLVGRLATSEQHQTIDDYKIKASQKSEIARQEMLQKKSGVFTGSYAINPVNGEKIPIWIADYVLMNYGTGAVMAVPAHDERDFEFAKEYGLSLRKVIEGGQADGACFEGVGVAVHSGFLSGQSTAQAKEAISLWTEKEGHGNRTVQYKLRDWLFSRQRYWGEPFPIVHLEGGEKQAVSVDQLPIILPAVTSYQPTGTGESPLSGITDWVNILDSVTGRPVQRETDTMPGSAGSSWYFLRYCDPHNDQAPFSPEAAKYWLPVDFYLGGSEHAVGHLLYARFWTKVLFDAGLVACDEPFKKLIHQGMILGEDGEKMSKSRGNVINPDHVVASYGADTLRIYEMFMGPLDRDKPWSTTAIEGVHRFLQRTWRLFVDDRTDGLHAFGQEASLEDLRMTHKTIKKVTEDIENLRFNTAVSQMMIFVNYMTQIHQKPKSCLRSFIQILQPFAPHLAEELWQRIGESAELVFEAWPVYDLGLARDELLTIGIQVMGKTRGTVEVEPGADQLTVESLAKKIATVSHQLEGKQIRKVIFVKDKILNFVL